MNKQLHPTATRNEHGAVRTSTIFLIITVIVAAISAGLIAWQIYYDRQHPREAAKRQEQIDRHFNDNSDKETTTDTDSKSDDTIDVSKLQVDNSVAQYFDKICADPNQGVDYEMCSDTNHQLRYDAAKLVAAIGEASKSDDKLLDNNHIIMANRKSDNSTVNVMAEQLSDKIKTVTAVDATTEAMVGNMNFGDILIVKNSHCTPDHFGSVASATNTITAIGRFYNTPMYFCQEIK